jgi:hypothetical protein
MSMFKKYALSFTMLALLLLGACARQYKPEELSPDIQVGGIYYTQSSLFQEGDHHRTTNYRRGTLIPINTPVTLVSINSKRIEIKLNATGQPLYIDAILKHTNEDALQAFKKTLGRQKVNLALFTPEEQRNILKGKVDKGMSKKAVLAALGYPPQIATASIVNDDWTYWSSRMSQFFVHFKNGKVSEIDF